VQPGRWNGDTERLRHCLIDNADVNRAVPQSAGRQDVRNSVHWRAHLNMATGVHGCWDDVPDRRF
jgi:hypothetical protein